MFSENEGDIDACAATSTWPSPSGSRSVTTGGSRRSCPRRGSCAPSTATTTGAAATSRRRSPTCASSAAQRRRCRSTCASPTSGCGPATSTAPAATPSWYAARGDRGAASTSASSATSCWPAWRSSRATRRPSTPPASASAPCSTSTLADPSCLAHGDGDRPRLPRRGMAARDRRRRGSPRRTLETGYRDALSPWTSRSWPRWAWVSSAYAQALGRPPRRGLILGAAARLRGSDDHTNLAIVRLDRELRRRWRRVRDAYAGARDGPTAARAGSTRPARLTPVPER